MCPTSKAASGWSRARRSPRRTWRPRNRPEPFGWKKATCCLSVRVGTHWRGQRDRGIRSKKGLAGLGAACLPWLHARKVAALGSDGASDVMPSGYEKILPIHAVTIVAMGIHLLDNCALDALAEACATRSRWTFLLAVAPLVLVRGTASPVNPLAIF